MILKITVEELNFENLDIVEIIMDRILIIEVKKSNTILV